MLQTRVAWDGNQSSRLANGKTDGKVEILTSKPQGADRQGEVNEHAETNWLMCVHFNARSLVGR